jgi:hypothetical protein
VDGEPQSVRTVVFLVLTLGIIGFLAPQSGGVPSAAQSCDRESVAELVRTFVRAYNSGNVNRADRRWAQEPDFEWYFVDDEREAEAEDRPHPRPLLPAADQFQ